MKEVKKKRTLASNKDARLKRPFFAQKTQKVARAILGSILVRKTSSQKLEAKIVETESYLGPEDKAAHVYKNKKTERNKIVYKKAGLVYIYLCYGIHWQLNFTTEEKNKPECILIRALEPLKGEGQMRKNREKKSRAKNITEEELTNGPGKLCQALKLNKDFYGEDLTTSERIWVRKGEALPESKIKSSKRIGIDYAEEDAEKPWRYYIEGNEYVSKS